MVRIKKKYQDFINESLVAKPKFDDSLSWLSVRRGDKQFIVSKREELKESIEVMADFFPGYFSDMCKKRDANPEKDYQEMQNLLNKKGWNFESIKNLFSESCNDLVGQDFQEWKNEGPLDSINGHCDVYLYFTAKNLGFNPDIVSLGGDGWSEYREPEEVFIRYAYGYHQTEYGKLMLKQNRMSEKEFTEIALTQLGKHIQENLYSVIWRFFEQKYKTSKDREFLEQGRVELLRIERNLNIEEIAIIEDDRLIIYFIQLNQILEEAVGIEFTVDELIAAFIKFLSPLKLKQFVSGGDLVIQTKEQVD